MFPFFKTPIQMPPPVGPAVRSSGTGISPASGAPLTPQSVTITADSNAHALNGLALQPGSTAGLIQGGQFFPLTGQSIDLLNQQITGTTPVLPAGGMAWAAIKNTNSQPGGVSLVSGVYTLSALANAITYDYSENPAANTGGVTANVFGSNFDPAMIVQIDNVTCTYTFVSSTDIIVNCPTRPAGAYLLMLKSGVNGSVVRSRVGFRYGPFSFTQVEQLVGNYDPAVGFTTAKWNDTSGASNHWLNGTGLNLAAFNASNPTFNNMPTIDGAGNSVMSLTTWNNGGVTTCIAIWAVMNSTSVSGAHALVTNEPTATDLYELNQANATQWEWSGNAHVFQTSFSTSPGTLYGACDQVSNTDTLQYRNGAPTVNASSKSQATLTTLNILSRLNTGVLSNQWNGSIARLLIATKAIPAGQRTIMSNAALSIWGCP